MKCSYLAHGKVILIGEHAVVYGYDALAMPIKTLHIKTTVEPAGAMWMDTACYHGPFFAAPSEYDGLKYVVKTTLAKTNRPEALKITYTGKIPTERGFGSSATVALATTKALDEYFDLGLSPNEVSAITNHAETINHGKASGLDAAAVDSDHLIFFNKEMGAKTLAAQLGAVLLIMDTGELGSTKEAVAQVQRQVEKQEKARARLAHLGQLTDEVKKAWLRRDQKSVGHCFTRAQAILRSFALSTAKIDELEKIALANGALGFKLSGSGLGGIVIALCPTRAVARAISAKSQKIAADSWIEEI